MGPVGLKQAAGLSHKQTRALASEVGKLPGHRVLNDGPVFDEVTVLCPSDAETVRHKLAKRGIIGGYPLGRDYAGFERALVFCATERSSHDELHRLVTGLAEIGAGR